MAEILRSLGQHIISLISKMSSRTNLIAASTLPPMRRVVTGHDAEGHGTVKNDTAILSKPATGPGSEGLAGGSLWTTESVPSEDTNNESVDGALRPIGGQGFVMRNGTNLRFTDLVPGASSPMHRTSSVDYNILSECKSECTDRKTHGMQMRAFEVSGKLILVLDDGSETLIENPGDTVVQKGNMHAWRNPGPGIARWMSVLVDAEPAVVNGVPLEDAWLA